MLARECLVAARLPCGAPWPAPDALVRPSSRLLPAPQTEPPSAFAGSRAPFADLQMRNAFGLSSIEIEVDDETE
jgi:hypothetical protein